MSRFFSSFEMECIDISTLEEKDLLKFLEKNILDFGNFKVEIDFLSDFSQSRLIRNAITFLFAKNHIQTPWTNRFALISDELVNNSIEYGSLPGEKNQIHIQFSTKREKLLVLLEVYDTGHGKEAKKSQEMEVIRKMKESRGFDSYLGKRGRGLFQIVTTMVDNLYFRDRKDGGLIVGIKKEFPLTQLT